MPKRAGIRTGLATQSASLKSFIPGAIVCGCRCLHGLLAYKREAITGGQIDMKLTAQESVWHYYVMPWWKRHAGMIVKRRKQTNWPWCDHSWWEYGRLELDEKKLDTDKV